ncbi:MAG TPA: chemotaxis protein CheW, partial [Candidatus Elarobacter sp.]|nr:chemotaxis protein CheW [Candidatus Elarobacter sp.]
AQVLERARDAGLVAPDAALLNDADLLRVLTHAGFSTAERVTDVSGRGVGLDVVDAAARALGGAIELKSVEGRGTVVTLRLPLSVAIVRALLARVGDGVFAIPFTHVRETVELEPPAAALRGAAWESAQIGDERLAVVPLRRAFGMPPRIAERMKGVSVEGRGRRAALIVDEFVGQQDIVVKRFDAPRDAVRLFAGATILGDGSPALIVDINRLI